MNILILGNATDAHAVHIKAALEQAGATAYYWDTQQFPTQSCLSWEPDSGTGSLVLPQGGQLHLNQIHSVFWRSFTGVRVPTLKDADQYRIAFHDSMSLVRSLMQACPAHWVNSWDAYEFHKEKPRQLNKAKQLGIRIPSTLISNDPEQITQFVQKHDSVIFKPVYGGAHTQRVTEDHLEPQRLASVLKLSPVTVQEFIPGTNVRSYVIGQSVYTAEIRSQSLDFREDQQACLLPWQLPEPIKEQCFAIANAFFLDWTAIDWRVKPSGEYVFLEANPSPMFLHFERQTSFPITAQLVQLLTE